MYSCEVNTFETNCRGDIRNGKYYADEIICMRYTLQKQIEIGEAIHC